MNSNLDNMKRKQESIDAIDAIVKGGEYLAAGLNISIQVGMNGKVVEFDLGITTDLKIILITLRNGLTDSRDYYRRQARKDMAELVNYFGAQDAE